MGLLDAFCEGSMALNSAAGMYYSLKGLLGGCELALKGLDDVAANYAAKQEAWYKEHAGYTTTNLGISEGGKNSVLTSKSSTINSAVIGKGGSKTNGIIDGKTPASRLADKVQGLSNSKRPNTVAVVRTADGRYYIGYNKAGVNNAEVQSIMDSLGNTNTFNRQCAEVNAISRAINKGANLDGATISVANVRSVGNYSGLHGTSKPPCKVCQPLLDYFGIEVVN